eukprot:765968-Hanusia_phi.AAC.9
MMAKLREQREDGQETYGEGYKKTCTKKKKKKKACYQDSDLFGPRGCRRGSNGASQQAGDFNATSKALRRGYSTNKAAAAQIQRADRRLSNLYQELAKDTDHQVVTEMIHGRSYTYFSDKGHEAKLDWGFAMDFLLRGQHTGGKIPESAEHKEREGRSCIDWRTWAGRKEELLARIASECEQRLKEDLPQLEDFIQLVSSQILMRTIPAANQRKTTLQERVILELGALRRAQRGHELYKRKVLVGQDKWETHGIHD